MKPYVFLLICLLLPAIPHAAAENLEPLQTAMVTGYTLTPEILNPGDTAVLRVTINEVGNVWKVDMSSDWDEDTGTELDYVTSSDKTIYIEKVWIEPNGILVLSPAFDNVGRMGDSNPLILDFLIRAPQKSGIYFPEIHIITDNGVSRFQIPINVGTSFGANAGPVLVVGNTVPDPAAPGESIPVTVQIGNTGGSAVGNVILTIDDELPGIFPIPSNTYLIGDIEPGESRSTVVQFLTDKNLEDGVHRVPVSLSYSLAEGSKDVDTASLVLETGSLADLRIYPANVTPAAPVTGRSFNLTVPLGNTGNATAENVTVSIDITLPGVKQADIGELEAGEIANASFHIDGGPEGIYPYNVTATYRDKTGIHAESRQCVFGIVPDPLFPVLVCGSLAIILAVLGLVYRYGKTRDA